MSELLEQTPSTAISLPQRAAAALGTAKLESDLRKLVTRSAAIKEIKNADGRDECHSAAMTLLKSRTSITKTGKTAREDAAAFTKAVIEEEKRLIAITQPEEDRLIALRDKWDQDRAAEKRAEQERERQRVESIKASINTVRNYPLNVLGKTADEISNLILQLSETPDYESFAEFADEYKVVRLEVLDLLAKAEAAARNTEAEAKRIEAERAELARLRAEQAAAQAERDRAAQAETAERERVAEVERQRQAEELAQQRKAFEAEKAETERLRKLEDEARASRIQAEREALEAENARIRLERAKLEQEKASVAPVAPAPALSDVSAVITPTAHCKPLKVESSPAAHSHPQAALHLVAVSDRQIIEVVIEIFGFTADEAIKRLEAIDFSAARTNLVAVAA